MRKIWMFSLSFIVILYNTGTVFASDDYVALGNDLPFWSIIPFIGMLLSIAIMPLVSGNWWEKHISQVVLFWSLVFLLPFGIVFGSDTFLHFSLGIILLDYLPFIVLLFGLFVTSGGIVLRGTLAGTPKTNLFMLLVGTLAAGWIGTTGASMLLIRPLIRANGWREKKTHIVVFFIFLVANIGGVLTPVGDPPLFLGFLKGVPFFWMLKSLPLLAFNTVVLLSLLFIIDMRLYKKELAMGKSPGNVSKGTSQEPLRIEGAHNFIFIGMIIGAVILSGLLSQNGILTGSIPIFVVVDLDYVTMIQMAVILIAATLSLKTTKKALRDDNAFTWGPIKEVGILFFGIFITMIPALALLSSNGSSMGISSPAQFFWAAGGLSSFLDNAPTYVVFLTTAGSLGAADGVATTAGVVAPNILLALSCGAVFMGANTYIGNAPNFMVKSIAEENHVKMPGFFGYMGWSICILIPLFVLNTLIFFS